MTVNARFLISAEDRTKAAVASVRSGLGQVEKAVFSVKGAVLTAVGVAGFGALIKTSFDTIDAQVKVADKLQVTTEALAGLHRATELYTSAGVGAMDEALTKATKRLGEFNASGGGAAAVWLKQLNLDTAELASLSPDQLFARYAESIRGLNDRGQQLAAISALMGDESRQLISIIDAGSGVIEQTTAEAIELGMAYSRVDAAKIEEANDAIATAKSVVMGAANAVAIELAPWLTASANLFIENATQAGGFGEIAKAAMDKVMVGVNVVLWGVEKLQIGWQTIKVGVIGMGVAALNVFNEIFQAIGKTNELLGRWGSKDLAAGVLLLDQVTQGFNQALADESDELVDLVNNSGNAGEAVRALTAEIQAATQARAEAAAANAVTNTGGNESTVSYVATDAELDAAIALQDQLDAVWDERTTARLDKEKENAQLWNDLWANTVNTFSQGVGDAFADAIVEQQNLADAMQSLFKSVVKQVISGMIAMAIKRTLLNAKAQAEEKAIVLSGAASAQTLAVAYAPAAAAASLASFGANAVPASAGITSTHALSQSFSYAGAFEEGGRIPRGSFGLVGEAGPEFIEGPANVISARRTADILNNNNNTTNVFNVNVHNNVTASTPDDIVEAMRSNGPMLTNALVGMLYDQGIKLPAG